MNPMTDEQYSHIIRTVRKEPEYQGFEISKQETEIILREGLDAPLRILLSEVGHTADLALEDGSAVTASKLRAHLLQFAEAREKVAD